MNTYSTSEIARIIGIHANTVRLYEECGLIPKPHRRKNGYRVFTDLHIEQFRLARAALKVEVLQNGLRKMAVEVIRLSAAEKYGEAKQLNKRYLEQIDAERENAEEAVQIVRQLILPEKWHIREQNASFPMTRKEAAVFLQITVDTLRNWEQNGLLAVKRKANGYRIYTGEDIRRLKVIRSLRTANYSLAAILRMLSALSTDPSADIRHAIDTPQEEEDVITACDRLLTSLAEARSNALYVRSQIEKMEKLKTLH